MADEFTEPRADSFVIVVVVGHSPKVEVVEAHSVVEATLDICLRERVEIDYKPELYKQFATVYAVVEYREGEKLGSLEEFFTATEVDLIGREGA